MDMKLRTALMNLQTNYGEASRKLNKATKDYKQLVNLGQRVYKQVITAQPNLADNPLWVNFRDALGIPVGAVDPVDPEAPDDDTQATVATVDAIGAVNKITTFAALTPAKRAELLAGLETALENARAHLDLPQP